jgi:hypothetical protein
MAKNQWTVSTLFIMVECIFLIAGILCLVFGNYYLFPHSPNFRILSTFLKDYGIPIGTEDPIIFRGIILCIFAIPFYLAIYFIEKSRKRRNN